MYVCMYVLLRLACAQSPPPPFSDFFLGGGGGCTEPISSSKLTDKVRRIVHLKLKPFPFQIKTYYLSDTNYQTNNPSHTNNPSLV